MQFNHRFSYLAPSAHNFQARADGAPGLSTRLIINWRNITNNSNTWGVKVMHTDTGIQKYASSSMPTNSMDYNNKY